MVLHISQLSQGASNTAALWRRFFSNIFKCVFFQVQCDSLFKDWQNQNTPTKSKPLIRCIPRTIVWGSSAPSQVLCLNVFLICCVGALAPGATWSRAVSSEVKIFHFNFLHSRKLTETVCQRNLPSELIWIWTKMMDHGLPWNVLQSAHFVLGHRSSRIDHTRTSQLSCEAVLRSASCVLGHQWRSGFTHQSAEPGQTTEPGNKCWNATSHPCSWSIKKNMGTEAMLLSSEVQNKQIQSTDARIEKATTYNSTSVWALGGSITRVKIRLPRSCLIQDREEETSPLWWGWTVPDIWTEISPAGNTRHSSFHCCRSRLAIWFLQIDVVFLCLHVSCDVAKTNKK